MRQCFRRALLAISIAGLAASAISIGKAEPAAPRISEAVDDFRLSRLEGNRHPSAIPENDYGRVPDEMVLAHMQLLLRSTPEQEQALQDLIARQHDQNSPDFHKWLTPDEFGPRFGPASQDIAIITGWLVAEGFAVNGVLPNKLVVDFTGTAGQVNAAFHTEIHQIFSRGERHFANMNDPYIPAALAPVIRAIANLDDFIPHPSVMAAPDVVTTNGNWVTPADLAIIYDLNPLFSSGTTGSGQTIAVLEESDLATPADWQNFRSIFGLSGNGTLTYNLSPGCTDPGVTSSEHEAMGDAEWASAAAPGAAILVVSCKEGVITAAQSIINSTAYAPTIISISFSSCEPQMSSSYAAQINSVYQQAVAQGISVFVSTGDSEAAGCDLNNNAPPPATTGLSVSGLATTPYNVAVGGTNFADRYYGTTSTYWSSSNGAYYASAKSYIPEIPWNDTCASQLWASQNGFAQTYGPSGFCNSSAGTAYATDAGGSGGVSILYAKPSWQSGIAGIPNDGARDVPDVAIFAGGKVWQSSAVACDSGISQPCTTNASGGYSFGSFGGTSLATPIMAGIQALVNQAHGGKQGNPNSVYYQLAASEYGASGNTNCNSSLGIAISGNCVFHDITVGDIDAACTGTTNCYNAGGTYGVLSRSATSYAPAYAAGSGYDLATGLGSVDAYHLVTNWSGSATVTNTLSVTLAGTGLGTVTSSPSGISCGAACSIAFSKGTAVTLTAAASSGSVFAGWSGACSGAAAAVTITISGDAGCTATFTVVPPTGLTGTTASSSGSVNGVTISGTSTYQLNIGAGTATIGITRIANASSSRTTGTLTLQLWALPSPYTGASQSGYLLASLQLNALPPGYNYNPSQGTVSLTMPPNGTYYLSLLVVDSTGCNGSACVDSWADFPYAIAVSGASVSAVVLPQTGWWWNPAEGGRGYSLELSPTDGTIFFAAYMYDTTGAPVWYASTLSTAGGNVYTGTLTEYQGGETLSGPYHAPTQTIAIGSVQLSFSALSTAALSITGQNINSTNVNIQRYAIISNGLTQLATSAQPQTGWWWNPAEGGRGYFFEVQGTTLFMAGYMYDASGKPIWYAAQNALTSSTSFSGTLVQYANGQTLGGPFEPASVANSNVGVLSFQLSSPSQGTMTLPDGVQIPIQRYAF